MNDNVIDFNGATTLPLAADKVLHEAKDKLDEVLVIGWDKDDSLYCASSTSDIAELILLIERAKMYLLGLGN